MEFSSATTTANKKSHRLERVAHEIKELAAGFLLSGVKGFELPFVSITRVKVSADLQIARIYFTTFGDTNIEQVEEDLIHVAPQVRYHISQNMRLRYSPKVIFHYDESYDENLRLEKLFGQISK